MLVDEAELWPDGQFVTTHLIVATTFLEEHPDVVDAVLRGLVQAIDQVNEYARGCPGDVSDAIEAITGSPIAPETMTGRGRTSSSPSTRSPRRSRCRRTTPRRSACSTRST